MSRYNLIPLRDVIVGDSLWNFGFANRVTLPKESCVHLHQYFGNIVILLASTDNTPHHVLSVDLFGKASLIQLNARHEVWAFTSSRKAAVVFLSSIANI